MSRTLQLRYCSCSNSVLLTVLCARPTKVFLSWLQGTTTCMGPYQALGRVWHSCKTFSWTTTAEYVGPCLSSPWRCVHALSITCNTWVQLMGAFSASRGVTSCSCVERLPLSLAGFEANQLTTGCRLGTCSHDAVLACETCSGCAVYAAALQTMSQSVRVLPLGIKHVECGHHGYRHQPKLQRQFVLRLQQRLSNPHRCAVRSLKSCWPYVTAHAPGCVAAKLRICMGVRCNQVSDGFAYAAAFALLHLRQRYLGH